MRKSKKSRRRVVANREIEQILAEYHSVRKEYNGLDKRDPANTARRSQLKLRFYELDTRYSELNSNADQGLPKRLDRIGSDRDGPVPTPAPPGIVSSSAVTEASKGETLWKGIFDNVAADATLEPAANWVETQTPPEGEDFPEDLFASPVEEEPRAEAFDFETRIEESAAFDIVEPEEQEATDEVEREDGFDEELEFAIEALEAFKDDADEAVAEPKAPAVGIEAETNEMEPVANIRPVECPSCGDLMPAGSTTCHMCNSAVFESEETAPRLRTKPRKPPAAAIKAGVMVGIVGAIGWIVIGIGIASIIAFATGVGSAPILSLLHTVGQGQLSDPRSAGILSAAIVLLGGIFVGIGMFLSRAVVAATPIHDLARTGRVEELEFALESGVNVNELDDRRCTPLHFAVVAGQRAAASVLITHDADLEARNERGDTPLHMAVANHDAALVTYLVEKGGDINARNASGSTLMHVAAWVGDVELIHALRDLGLDINARNKGELTPLHFTAQGGHEEAVDHLLKLGAEPDPSGETGSTPLCAAARNGHLATVDLLIRAGANPNCKEGLIYPSPLTLALDLKRHEVAEYLEAHGAAR